MKILLFPFSNGMQVNHEFAFEECANQFGFVFDLWGDTDSLASLAPLINGLRLFPKKRNHIILR